MDRIVEVVRIVEGRLFDEECYECAAVPEGPLARPPGFYAVAWPVGAPCRRYDSGATFVGPFATALQAEMALKGGHYD